MDFINDQIQKYADQFTTPESKALSALNRETHLKVLMPRMLSGHFQGRLLSMISQMIRPDRILEIGTYTGYSGICLAEGLKENGLLYTIDINDELTPMVTRYVHDSGMSEKIKVINGDAAYIIPELNELFDLVFIDADKSNYSLYYDLVFNKLKSGGYILADNVLWSGKVVDPQVNDKDTQIIRDFNQKVFNDDRTEKILLPVRDGIYLIRKK